MSAPAAAWDALVVGAGPAGSALAARLAGEGWRVLVVDRAAFPRRKPCGECLSPAAVAALRALGAWPAVAAARPALLEGWRIRAGAGWGFAGAFPAGQPGIAVPRAVLDALLLDHARARGAAVEERVRVTDLLFEHGRVAGVHATAADGAERELRARLVVGADGLRSVVLRRLRLLRRGPRLRKLALTAHVAGIDGTGGFGELHARGCGCLGLADVGDGTANVTVVVPADEEGKAVGGAADAYFDAALAEYGFGGARRVDEVLATGPFDWPVRRAVADGALLVGDAAGYYDPFTGQGIFRALRGAELAAAAAAAALRAGDVSAGALMAYERARRRAFGPGERLQRVIEGFVARPALLRLAAGRLARRPALGDAVVRVTGDLRPVRSLLNPGLLARLVF